MKRVFYGTEAAPPSLDIASAFGAQDVPIRLAGGQGTTYRAGPIVLKPARDYQYATWEAFMVGVHIGKN